MNIKCKKNIFRFVLINNFIWKNICFWHVTILVDDGVMKQKRKKKRETERHTHREREREQQRQTDRQRQRQTDRHRQTQNSM